MTFVVSDLKVTGRVLLVSLLLMGHVLHARGQALFDLDAPGALEALARDNPRHYEKVREILRKVQAQPYDNVPGWLQTRFDARNAIYGPLLLTSLPPKRHLSFTIDEVRYHTLMTEQRITGTNQQALFEQATLLEAQARKEAPSSAQFGSEAVKTYVRAAQLGSAAAANRLAEIYDRGLPGVPRNPDEAQKWRNAARVLGQ